VDDRIVQLHLGHRISQRLLSRFLSQGFVHKDLSRACFAQSDDRIPRVVLLGRLGLYGPGASRLHEEIITITARWAPPTERAGDLQPYARDAEARTMQILESAMSDPSSSRELPPAAASQLLASMAADVEALLPHLETRGNEARDAAAKRLSERARIESEEMSRILHEQRSRVLKTLEKTEGDPHQLDFFTVVEERRQVEDNMRYWRKWLTEVETDLKTEPARIAEFYDVKTTRIEPVGIVYLWPA
jgi:hypothetical protein